MENNDRAAWEKLVLLGLVATTSKTGVLFIFLFFFFLKSFGLDQDYVGVIPQYSNSGYYTN